MEAFSSHNNNNNKGSFKSISSSEFKRLITEDKVQLLDVRTPLEFELGKIEGATLIDYYDANFEQQVDEQLDVQIPVAIYCRSGVRSVHAGLLLKKKGFTVFNLEKGIISLK